jgi:hypothetical protein
LSRYRKWLMLVLTVIVSVGFFLPSGGILQAAKKDSAIVPIQVNRVPLNFIVNGQLYLTPNEQEGFVFNNNTYVPLRFAAYTFGQDVRWDADTYTVTIGNPTQVQQEIISNYNTQNRRELSEKVPSGTNKGKAVKLDVSMKPVKYIFSNEEKIPSSDRPGIMYQGTLYVPFRFFSESLGIKLDYDGKTRSITALVEKVDEKGANQTASNGTIGNVTPVIEVPTVGGSAGSSPIITVPAPKKSYDSIVNETNTSLTRLKASCRNKLAAVYLVYVNATTEEAKLSAIQSGYSIVASCDSEFLSLMSSFTRQMTDNGYEYTAAVESYSKAYDQEKETAIKALLN